VKSYGINEVHSVTQFGEPGRVDPRPPTDIEDVAGAVREVAQHDLLRAFELEGAGREPTPQALGFLSSFVIGADVRIQFHGAIKPGAPSRCRTGDRYPG
jgi:hypothetical protein